MSIIGTPLELSLSESIQLKGLSLLLLLCHHLFYIQQGQYDDILLGDYGIVHQIGITCKVCVALFVFLSGYGLAKKYDNKDIIIKAFFIERFTKLMMNYWFVWLLFVPMGILFFNRTFTDVYGNHVLIKGIIDFMGLSDCMGFYGYNATWWFMSCIIILYGLFPFLVKSFQKHGIALLVVSVVIVFFPMYIFTPIKYYLFPFLLGIACVQKRHFGINVNKKLNGGGKILIITVFLFCIRNLIPHPYPLLFDGVLSLFIIASFKLINLGNTAINVLSFMGKHSMNIFLFHTFIYYYYFHDFIYWTQNPILILLTLLFVCLSISVGMEYLKKSLSFDGCCKFIIQFLKKNI